MQDKKSNAGRKPVHPDLRRENICVRLPRWLINSLPEGNAGALIERALCKFLKIKKPVIKQEEKQHKCD